MNPCRLGGMLLVVGLAGQAGAGRVGQAADLAAAPKFSPMLNQVLGRVLGSAAGGDATPGLFDRLAKRLDRLHAEPEDSEAEASADELVPTLGYAMELLDPASFAVLRPVPVAGGGAVLRTGDVFVLQFSTNLPGRVRLQNTDGAGEVADLGTYTVLVDQLNRVPRDRGIQLQGRPGQERLSFYFYPCLPVEAAGKPWAVGFQGRLPPCSQMPPERVAGDNAAAYGTVTPRALIQFNQPDASMVFAGTENFKAGEVTLLEARIRHEGRPGGR